MKTFLIIVLILLAIYLLYRLIKWALADTPSSSSGGAGSYYSSSADDDIPLFGTNWGNDSDNSSGSFDFGGGDSGGGGASGSWGDDD